MSNRNLHKVINNMMERKDQVPLDSDNSKYGAEDVGNPQYQPTNPSEPSNQMDYRGNVNREPIVQNTSEKKAESLADKRLAKAGLVMMGVFVFAVFVTLTFHSSTSVDVSEEAAQAIEQQVSTTLPIGTRLMSEDESLGGRDLTITHSSIADKNKIYIWDYAAEDGDYVQVLVDGVALGDPFMIKKKPIELEVPTTGEVQVLGTRDGGGGITYAIHYDLNGTTYFNGTSVGDGNLYTLIRE